MPDRVAHFINGQWQLGETLVAGVAQADDSWSATFLYFGKWALWIIATVIVLSILSNTMKVVNEYTRLVIFRLGRFKGVSGPGIVFLIPFVDQVQASVSLRTTALSLTAENTMTRDAVSVTIEAVVFWRVVDPPMAVLSVQEYWKAIEQVALVSMREMIGSCTLATLLSERQVVDEKLKAAIDTRVAQWGLDVSSVDIKDVEIPEALDDAMSRQAQAERERAAITPDVQRRRAHLRAGPKSLQGNAPRHNNDPCIMHPRRDDDGQERSCYWLYRHDASAALSCPS